MTPYQFNSKKFNHYFCPTCGCTVVCYSEEYKSFAVNLRAVEGVNVDEIPDKTFFDGAKLPVTGPRLS